MPTNDPPDRLFAGVGLCWLGLDVCDGAEAMALDDALLDWVRAKPLASSGLLAARAYQWRTPTWSLGVNQSAADCERLRTAFERQRSPESPALEWVRRPTGGRAILHGRDVSFSFISDAPALLRLSVADSYRVLNNRIAEALSWLGATAQYPAHKPDSRAYTRSPACFESRTETDFLDGAGRKISGSAQLRRAGGLLQQGSLFLDSQGVSAADFSQALSAVLKAHMPTTALEAAALWQDAGFQRLLHARRAAYQESRVAQTTPSASSSPTTRA